MDPQRPSDSTRRFWNAHADTWHDTDRERAGNDDVGRTVELLGLQAGARVLDAGCGTGRRAHPLHTAGFDVVAVDLADAMVRYAATTLPGRVPQADVHCLPFKADAFDAARPTSSTSSPTRMWCSASYTGS